MIVDKMSCIELGILIKYSIDMLILLLKLLLILILLLLL